MKTGVKPETVCELQDTNDHRQVERKWRLPISVGELSTLEGRLINLLLPQQPWMIRLVRVRRSHVESQRTYGVISSAYGIRRADLRLARGVRCPGAL